MSPENSAYRYELLAEKWLNGTITPEEAQEYADWYLANQEKPIGIPAAFAASRQVQHDRILDKLHKSMGEPGKAAPLVHRVHFMRRSGWWAAAAIILLLGAGAYFWTSRPAGRLAGTTKPVQKDIPPGGNKAVLTLAGGQTIVLDSAANGMLATQGASQVIKQDNGQLAYTSDKQAHSAALLYNTLSTPRGGQYRLTLPDGTGVWLNAASSITYPTAFTAQERKVTVTGEAYFEVAQDKSKPFHVQVNNMEVTVLGTYFNINAYTNEADIKTTLLEGSVRISRGGDTKLLRPGQQAQAGNAAAIRVVDDVNTSQVVAWKNGLFDFKDADLKAVMRQLERWYDIQVEYKGVVSGYAFRGKLQRSLNLAQVLHILDEMEVKYTLQGRVLTVNP